MLGIGTIDRDWGRGGRVEGVGDRAGVEINRGLI